MEWRILSSEDDARRAYFVRGTAIDAAANAQKRARAGEVVVDGSVDARRADVAVSAPSTAADGRLDLASTFFPRDVLLAREQGEFRDVVTVFVALPTLDDACLADLARIALRARDAY